MAAKRRGHCSTVGHEPRLEKKNQISYFIDKRRKADANHAVHDVLRFF